MKKGCLHKIFSPFDAFIECVKKVIVFLVELQIIERKKDEVDEGYLSRTVTILSNYFNMFFSESNFDLTDRLKKHVRACLIKMCKIYKIDNETQKIIHDNVGNILTTEFKILGDIDQSIEKCIGTGKDKIEVEKIVKACRSKLANFKYIEQRKVIFFLIFLLELDFEWAGGNR